MIEAVSSEKQVIESESDDSNPLQRRKRTSRGRLQRRTERVLIERLVVDEQIQSRVALSNDAVADYGEAIKGGANLPAVVVFDDGESLWLADGFHRVRAAKQCGRKTIQATILTGSYEDARWYGAGANRCNGVRMTSEDKRRAVGHALLANPDASDRSIANHVGVDHRTVGNRRHAMSDLIHLKRGFPGVVEFSMRLQYARNDPDAGWRKSHSSFAQFCAETWGFTPRLLEAFLRFVDDPVGAIEMMNLDDLKAALRVGRGE